MARWKVRLFCLKYLFLQSGCWLCLGKLQEYMWRDETRNHLYQVMGSKTYYPSRQHLGITTILSWRSFKTQQQQKRAWLWKTTKLGKYDTNQRPQTRKQSQKILCDGRQHGNSEASVKSDWRTHENEYLISDMVGGRRGRGEKFRAILPPNPCPLCFLNLIHLQRQILSQPPEHSEPCGDCVFMLCFRKSPLFRLWI